MSARKLFRFFRIFILLLILISVALGSWLTTKRSTDWERPLWVAIYPINADNSPVTREYIRQLSLEDFTAIEEFMAEEAKEHGLTISKPMTIKLAPQVTSLPPEPPASAAVWEIMLWSLQLRYWAYNANTFKGPAPHIRVFVKYYDVKDRQPLPHSIGLPQGMLGIVNAFADRKMTSSNAVVITHEVLHTLGATDKYDLNSGQPLYPDGFAEPALQPLRPQQLAEIMGGKIPLEDQKLAIPRGLHEVVVGKKTAREIRWIE